MKSLLEMYDLCIHTNFYGGAIGFNVNVANALAAVFIATGQDVACVVEGSSAELIISPVSVEEIEEKGCLFVLENVSTTVSEFLNHAVYSGLARC